MARMKKEMKEELKKITDVVDLNMVNTILASSDQLEHFSISEKTLMNIAQWALDGKSQFEIAHNLELTPLEWQYLVEICPAILLVMQHSRAYADIVVAGTLFQTAIGGQKIKKKVPLKVKEYEVDSRGRSIVVGEHYEMVEIEETTPANPYLLKWLAEHKLSEQFGKETRDSNAEHRGIIDAMTEEERKAFEEMK